jgi:hypothetical protein
MLFKSFGILAIITVFLIPIFMGISEKTKIGFAVCSTIVTILLGILSVLGILIVCSL